MSGEKNKKPTKKRVQESREKGQVAQTPSVPHLMAAVGTFELLVGTREHWLSRAPMVLGTFIDRLGEVHPSAKVDVKDLLLPLGGMGLGAVLLVLAFAAVLGLIGNVMQTGIVVATKGMVRPDRLNPIGHLTQMLSAAQLGELVMNAVKVSAIGFCAGMGVLMSIDSLLHLGDGTLMQAVDAVVRMLALCERLAIVVLIVCVTIDWALRRQATNKQMMMSHQEIEQEQKDQFGSKQVRKQRNEFRRDMLAGELTESTRKANAVVTNPTHFAVALYYDSEKFPLPFVLARGTNAGAALMRKVARDAGIPIIRSPQLARTLYSVGREWRPVPRITLKAVAAVYRVVAEIKAGERRLDDVVDLETNVPEQPAT